MEKRKRTWAGVAGDLRERAQRAATAEEILEALSAALAELEGIEQEAHRAELEELARWKQERETWAERCRRIFRELPPLLSETQGVVSSLEEDERFGQAPAGVQERLRNRKEGLEIICRMLERLSQRQEPLDRMAADDPRAPRRFELAARLDPSRLGPLEDPAGAPAIPELLEELAREEEEVREENYRLTRQLRQEAEELQQAVAGLLRDRLLPVIDGLERGLWDEAELKRPLEGYPEARELIEGWFGAYPQCDRRVRAFLERIGLEPVEVRRGEAFDPQRHLALGRQACPELQDGQVLEVVRSGWGFWGLPLRPAEVLVVRNEEEKSGGQAEGRSSAQNL